MVAQVKSVRGKNESVVDLAAKRLLTDKFKGNGHSEFKSEKNKILSITVSDIFHFCEIYQIKYPTTTFSRTGSYEQMFTLSSVASFLNMEEKKILSLFSMSFNSIYNPDIDLLHGQLFNWCFWGCKYEVDQWLISPPALALIVLSKSNRSKNSIIYKFKSTFGFNPTKSRNLWWYQEWLLREFEVTPNYEKEILHYLTHNEVLPEFIMDSELVSSVNTESKQVIKQIMQQYNFKRTFRGGVYGWINNHTVKIDIPF